MTAAPEEEPTSSAWLTVCEADSTTPEGERTVEDHVSCIGVQPIATEDIEGAVAVSISTLGESFSAMLFMCPATARDLARRLGQAALDADEGNF